MSDVLLGATLPQFTGDAADLVDGARRAEAAGLDSIWLFDHLWPLTGGKTRPVFECWSALAYLAAATERITIGTLVTRSSLRHPAVLAKMAATVGAIAPGRVVVTIGSGDHASRSENEAYGIRYLAGAERIEQLVGTVQILRSFLDGNYVTGSDGTFELRQLRPSPVPDPRPPIWVGGRADDVLEVAGRVADGWNGWAGTPERFAQDLASVVGYANGRPIEPSWGGLVALGADDAEAEAKVSGRSSGFLVGGPEKVAAGLRGFVDAGARHVVCTFPDPRTPGLYELLADEVGPRLKAGP